MIVITPEKEHCSNAKKIKISSFSCELLRVNQIIGSERVLIIDPVVVQTSRS